MASTDNETTPQVGAPRPRFLARLQVWMHAVLRLGFAWAARPRAEQRMELLETLQLGGKRQLMLVLCEGQRYLVGAGGDSVHSIAAIQHQSGAKDSPPSSMHVSEYALQSDITAHRSNPETERLH